MGCDVVCGEASVDGGDECLSEGFEGGVGRGGQDSEADALGHLVER